MVTNEEVKSATTNSQFPFNDMFTSSEMELINQNSNSVKYNRGDVIFKQSTRTSHVMYVTGGLVKIYKENRQGKILILKLTTPNNFIGLLSVFGDDAHQYSASAVETTEIFFIDIQVVKKLIQKNSKFALELLREASKLGNFIFDRLMSNYQKQLPGRIADVILYFSEVIYESNSFIFPLTRRELAELAATTKESFIRTLTEFKNDKIINLDGKRVEIQSMKILKKLSDIG